MEVPKSSSNDETPDNFEMRKVPHLSNAFSRDQNRYALPVPSYIMSTSSQPHLPQLKQQTLPAKSSDSSSVPQGVTSHTTVKQSGENPPNPSLSTPSTYQSSTSSLPLHQISSNYNQSVPAHLSQQFSQQYNQLLSRPIRQSSQSSPNSGNSSLSSIPFSSKAGLSGNVDRSVAMMKTASPPASTDQPNLNSEQDAQYNTFNSSHQVKRKHVHNQYSSFSQVTEHDMGRNNTNRPYKCTFANCKWAFVRESDLRRHLKSHEAPSFHCPYWRHETNCHRNGGAFSRLDVLKRHLRLIHYIQDKQQSKSLAKSNPPGKDDPGWCKACQKVFANSKAFLEHVNDCSEQVAVSESTSQPNEYYMDPHMNLRTLSSVIDYTSNKNSSNNINNNEFPTDNDDQAKVDIQRPQSEQKEKSPVSQEVENQKRKEEFVDSLEIQTQIGQNQDVEVKDDAKEIDEEDNDYQLPSQIRKSRRKV